MCVCVCTGGKEGLWLIIFMAYCCTIIVYSGLSVCITFSSGYRGTLNFKGVYQFYGVYEHVCVLLFSHAWAKIILI